ncbi:MAG: hypothetical protein LBK75_00685 [Oscillospiraceae bacterium]|jgi:hypothetical protein|nr:hypothetical protein [Oscillospiraceae bacterium]
MKISYYELKREIERIHLSLSADQMNQASFVGIHHVHDWDHGYESDLGYAGKRREFYADMRDMISFLTDYIDECDISEFIIAPFHRVNQFSIKDKSNDIYLEIKNFFSEHDVKNQSQSGVKLSIDTNESILEMVIEGAFRGISELCILFHECNVLLVPNHHFDFPFFTHYISEEKKTIEKLLLKHPKLLYYESTN